jgi:hypothetical protein
MLVKSPAERLRLIKRVFGKWPSERKLRAILACDASKKRNGGRDEPHLKLILDRLLQIIDQSRAMVKQFAIRDKEAFDRLPGRADQPEIHWLLRGPVVAAQNLVDELAAQASAAKDRLAQSRRHPPLLYAQDLGWRS